MSDQALDWMLNTLRETPTTDDQQLVWCTDENALNGLTQLPHTNLQIITNRWDVAEQANACGLKVQFSDFDFSQHPDNCLDGFYYRVSKEKLLVNHLLNQAWRCLKPDGTLWLSGFKNDGVKTYIDKISQLFGCEKVIQKDGQIYSARLKKKSSFSTSLQLDTADYSSLRPVAEDSGLRILSKPGLFGWNKVDAGSALLIQQLSRICGHIPTPATCLDLGCGYGFLTLAASQYLGKVGRWILTDNNAAALIAAAENLRLNHLNGEVIGADAGAGIKAETELLVCNPPFHQGFSTDGDLTDKFIASASRLVAKKGLALFVVNQFIPLERKALGHFRQVKTMVDNGSFKVVGLSHYPHAAFGD